MQTVSNLNTAVQAKEQLRMKLNADYERYVSSGKTVKQCQWGESALYEKSKNDTIVQQAREALAKVKADNPNKRKSKTLSSRAELLAKNAYQILGKNSACSLLFSKTLTRRDTKPGSVVVIAAKQLAPYPPASLCMAFAQIAVANVDIYGCRMTNENDETRIDWFRVIVDLKRLGVSLYGIECETGISRTTVHGYKNGAEPKHADGELILGLWMRMTSKKREEAPIERRYRIARGR